VGVEHPVVLVHVSEREVVVHREVPWLSEPVTLPRPAGRIDAWVSIELDLADTVLPGANICTGLLFALGFLL